jgi:hypothetical protein
MQAVAAEVLQLAVQVAAVGQQAAEIGRAHV